MYIVIINTSSNSSPEIFSLFDIYNARIHGMRLALTQIHSSLCPLLIPAIHILEQQIM